MSTGNNLQGGTEATGRTELQAGMVRRKIVVLNSSRAVSREVFFMIREQAFREVEVGMLQSDIIDTSPCVIGRT